MRNNDKDHYIDTVGWRKIDLLFMMTNRKDQSVGVNVVVVIVPITDTAVVC
jgi:hypothetical protein